MVKIHVTYIVMIAVLIVLIAVLTVLVINFKNQAEKTAARYGRQNETETKAKAQLSPEAESPLIKELKEHGLKPKKALYYE